MNDNRRMPARLSAFVIWALVAASVGLLGLRLLGTPTAVPAHATLVSQRQRRCSGDLARLFGADAGAGDRAPRCAAPQADARFQLLGVVAPRSARRRGRRGWR